MKFRTCEHLAARTNRPAVSPRPEPVPAKDRTRSAPPRGSRGQGAIPAGGQLRAAAGAGSHSCHFSGDFIALVLRQGSESQLQRAGILLRSRADIVKIPSHELTVSVHPQPEPARQNLRRGFQQNAPIRLAGDLGVATLNAPSGNAPVSQPGPLSMSSAGVSSRAISSLSPVREKTPLSTVMSMSVLVRWLHRAARAVPPTQSQIQHP